MDTLKTYWDLEPKTRAALSESDVRRYVDAELMLKGVLKLEPPTFDEEPPLPEIAKTTWYKAEGYAPIFANAEQAMKFLDLNPRIYSTKHVGDYWNSCESFDYIEDARHGVEIVPVRVVTEGQLAAHKSAIDARGEAQQSNRKKREEYDKAIKLQNQALEGLWADWHARRAVAAQHRKVVDTYEAYCKTAGGDSITAAKFLQKVFSVEQIREASEWFVTSIPTAFEAQAPEPGPSHPDAPESQPVSDDIAF